MRWLAALVAIASVSCTIDVSIENKGCPCVDGYVCDLGLDRCVPDTCAPKITVEDFRAVWSTSNTIRWGWTPRGEEADFLAYELWVAPTQPELASDARRVYGVEHNPELGFFSTSAETMTTGSDGLEPGTSYVAHLRATDNTLCTSGTALVAESTLLDPQSSITLFRDTIPEGGELAPGPPVFDVANDAEGAHLLYDVAQDVECNPDVDDPAALCGQPLRLRRLDRNLARDPAQPAAGGLRGVNDAFLELRVSNTSPVPSFYTEVWLRFGDCFGEQLYEWDNWAMRSDGEYFTVQVPLVELRSATGQPLTFDVVESATLCEVAVGAQWHKNGRARVDDIVIRY